MSFIQEITEKATRYLDLETPQKHTRCSGCGNYGILNALMMALALEDKAPHEVILACDVGCSGNVSDKIELNTIHGLHGRVLPLATGIQLARPDMPVIAMAGDGATLSEWVNHLIHTARNNYNITFLLHNNHNYWLTTGQASSTTPKWVHMNATSWVTTATPLLPAQLVLAAGGTFVARWYSWNPEQLIDLIRQGLHHPWFSFIEILQLCPTYSKATPQERYEQRIYDISTRDSYDSSDKFAAYELVEDMEHLATWILYHNKHVEDFLGLQEQRAWRKTTPATETKRTDISTLLDHFIVI
jgi:2-oxoglutarate/2-oxoacid ferredoxin oxidoreductase subunit beta